MAAAGKFQSTKWGAAALYAFPALYGAVLLLIGFSVNANSKTGSLFVTFCITLGILCCITTLIGLFGVCGLNEPAIRSTVVLVVLENILAFVLAIFLAVHLFQGPSGASSVPGGHPGPLRGKTAHDKHHGGLPHLVTLLHTPSWHETAAVVVCCLVFLCTCITSCSVGILSEFQAMLDAELLLQESRGLKELEGTMPGMLLPPRLGVRRGSGSSSGEGQIAVPFISLNGEGFDPVSTTGDQSGTSAHAPRNKGDPTLP